MFYWLYTSGFDLLRNCLIPLICLSAVMPLMLSLMLGRGIQRSDQAGQTSAIGCRRLLLFVTYVVVNLASISLYLALTRNLAIARLTRRATTNSIILALAGGPASIDPMRLFMAGVLLLFVCFTVSLVLREAVRNGGWLRERTDRLRRPNVARGVMGSAHFCTNREYRRYRRSDPDGITLYGAFWGRDRMRLDYGFGR